MDKPIRQPGDPFIINEIFLCLVNDRAGHTEPMGEVIVGGMWQ